jgi:photosystem II stability/assembly factor-like uncharacterized protein
MKGSNFLKNAFALVVLTAFAVQVSAVVNNPNTAASAVPRFKSWDVIGPAGGDVRVVAVDPRHKDRLIVSTLDGQIHKSFDGGKNWVLLANLDRPNLVLDQLAFDVEDSSIIYASGHRHKDPGGFFKSEDGGRTWREIKQISHESIHAQAQSTQNPNMIVIGTVTGVFASFDRGETWKKIIRETIPAVDSLAIDPRDTRTIYAGTWWRMYKTTNGGESWRLVKNGMIDDSDVFAININHRNPDHIIASACSGIYESFNGGELWKKIQGIPSQARRTRDILQHPSRPGVYYAGTTEGFWMSPDAGASWSMTTGKDLEVNSIAVHPDRPERVYLGTNNHGVLVSEDGGRSFNPNNGNFTSRFAYTIVPDIERPNRLYATTQNTATGGGFMFISEDGGDSWTRARNFDVIKISPMGLVQDRGNPEIIYMATASGLLKSVNRGLNWAPVAGAKSPAKAPPAKRSTSGPSGPGGGVRRTTIATAPVPTPTAGPAAGFVSTFTERIKALSRTEDGRSGLFAGTDKGLYRTYDVTKGWERLNLGVGVQSSVISIYVNPKLPSRVWVGTATAGLFVSEDGGKVFSRVETVPRGVPINTITGDPVKTERVYVGTAQTFYVNQDGTRFVRRGGNLPLGNYTSVIVNPLSPNEVIIASALEQDGGIFFSADHGWTWTRLDGKDQQLASRRVWAMAFDPSNPNRIFAGTHSSGIYRLERVSAGPAGRSSSTMR